jgi:hypothetical protein
LYSELVLASLFLLSSEFILTSLFFDSALLFLPSLLFDSTLLLLASLFDSELLFRVDVVKPGVFVRRFGVDISVGSVLLGGAAHLIGISVIVDGAVPRAEVALLISAAHLLLLELGFYRFVRQLLSVGPQTQVFFSQQLQAQVAFVFGLLKAMPIWIVPADQGASSVQPQQP